MLELISSLPVTFDWITLQKENNKVVIFQLAELQKVEWSVPKTEPWFYNCNLIAD